MNSWKLGHVGQPGCSQEAVQQSRLRGDEERDGGVEDVDGGGRKAGQDRQIERGVRKAAKKIC